MKFFGIAIITALFLRNAFCHRAPDVSPNFPDGWCDKRAGSPTRTTGECICRFDCDGPKCRRQEGIIWYAYKECPTCRCILKDSIPISDVKSDTNEVGQEDIKPEFEIRKSKQRSSFLSENPPDLSEEESLFEYYFDKYGKFGIAIVTIAIVSVVVLPLLFTSVQNSPSNLPDVNNNISTSPISCVNNEKDK